MTPEKFEGMHERCVELQCVDFVLLGAKVTFEGERGQMRRQEPRKIIAKRVAVGLQRQILKMGEIAKIKVVQQLTEFFGGCCQVLFDRRDVAVNGAGLRQSLGKHFEMAP